MKSIILNELETSLTSLTDRLRGDMYRTLKGRGGASQPVTVAADAGGLRVDIHLGSGTVEASISEPASEPAQPRAETMRGIVDLFVHAKSKLKYPKIHFTMPDDRPLSLSLAGDRARVPGSVNVTDGGRYGANTWYGRIHRDGRYETSRQADEGVREFLLDVATDPAGAAGKHGRRTGNCCFCNAKLTDPRSVQVGYGQVCANSFGLPWGKKGGAE